MPEKPLKVALLQYRDARNVRSWSGTFYFSKAAIEKYVGPVVDLSPAPVRMLPFRVAAKLVHLLTGKRYSFDHDPTLARFYGWYFQRLIERERPDLIYAPAGSACIAHLETDVPIVYFSDATWRLVNDYYPNFSNVIERTARAGEALEQAAIDMSAVSLFSSEWAAKSAVDDYGADPSRVHNVRIGANLPELPTREEALSRRLGSPIRLLFVGALWDVKGGQVAYETLLNLLDSGIDAELTVTGCVPPAEVRHPKLTITGFLDKRVPEQRAVFERSWKEADFFLLPSRCEAAGIVFCEAAAHGLPVLTTHTGGIPSIVVDGENGYTLPLDAGGEAFARTIAEIAGDPGRYAALCVSSRKAFEERLNWDAWGSQVAAIIAATLPAFAPRIEEWQRRAS